MTRADESPRVRIQITLDNCPGRWNVENILFQEWTLVSRKGGMHFRRQMESTRLLLMSHFEKLYSIKKDISEANKTK